MIWWQLTLLIFGALTVLLLSGIPVAFAFITINIAGGLVYLGGVDGLPQLARSGLSAITNFSLTPIPFFLLMGELLLHTGVAMKALDVFQNNQHLLIVTCATGTAITTWAGRRTRKERSAARIVAPVAMPSSTTTTERPCTFWAAWPPR